jgi:hypothetical protein
MEEPRADIGARASADQDASQPGGGFHADELGRSGAEVYGETAAARGHLENPPPVDLELCEDTRMNGLGPADGIPKLRFELIQHRPEQGSTEPLGRLCAAAGGHFALAGRDISQVLRWQPIDIIKAVSPPARWSRGSSLEVIHLRND